tara:strand:+ start:586 stop:1179 length:594 start_codon:yes stop_codon:yes gene_type:complete
MSQLKLTADGGGGTVAIKGPASTTGNAAIELTLPGTGNSTLLTSATNTGKILQVVSTYSTTHISTTSTSFVDSGISATITPSSSSSKILIQSTFSVGSSDNQAVYFKLYNGSNEITAATNGNSSNGVAFATGIDHGSGAQFDIEQVGHNFLYTSNTTSATTIKIYWRCDTGTAYINRYGYSTAVGGGSALTLYEVGA